MAFRRPLFSDAGRSRQIPVGGLMAGSALVMESVPAGMSEVIPAGYQLVLHEADFEVAGTLEIGGKLVLL